MAEVAYKGNEQVSCDSLIRGRLKRFVAAESS
jgi:hypothetical protein